MTVFYIFLTVAILAGFLAVVTWIAVAIARRRRVAENPIST